MILIVLNRAVPPATHGGTDLDFPYTITGISAADLLSHDALSGDITVSPDNSSGTLTIRAMQDAVDEGVSETMTVTLGTLPMNDGNVRITSSPTPLTTTITITDNDTELTYSGITQAALNWTQNAAITPVTLPAASGGDGTLTYSLSPNLPSGVTFNATTRRLSGTPTVSAAQRQYTLTARDTDGDTDTLRFNITVAAAGGEITDTTPEFTTTQADLNWTRGTAITAVTLPAATGGDGFSLIYSLSPALPRGVTFTASTRRLTGTPAVSASQRQYTLIATDVDGDIGRLRFNITVAAISIADALASFTVTPSSINLPVSNASIPPVGDRRNVTLTVGLNGFTLSDRNFSVIATTTPTNAFACAAVSGGGYGCQSGSPTRLDLTDITVLAGQSQGTGTFMAAVSSIGIRPTQIHFTITPPLLYSDGGVTLTQSVNINTVAADGVPSFSGTQPALSWTQNTAITPVTLPAASGGDGTLTYSLSPALPNGVTFTASNRRLSGTPTVSAAQRQYTLTVRDGDGDTDTLQFNITVAADRTPSFSGTQAALSWTQNTAITPVLLPAATGGDGTLTYSLSPNLPNGVTFTASNRRLSGTPTVSAAQRQYTLTVRDGDGDTDTLRFNITVAADRTPSFSGTQAALSWTQNTAITSVFLPAASGGDGTLTYSLSPNLPSGVTFTASTRRLSGTPTVSAAQRQYTLTVRDGDGDTDTLQFNITVAADRTPSFSGTQAALSWTQNTAITPVFLPLATGGDGTLTYSLSPNLPSGVTFNATTRQLSGTPTVSAAQRQYTLTARDTDGDTDTLQFNITVTADRTPSFSGTQAALSWTQNTAITSVLLPAASGGDGTLTYSLSPNLPSGVTFNATTRRLSGTPTVSAAQRQYTLTVRDTDGDTDTLQFNITVAAASVPPSRVVSFVASTVPARTLAAISEQAGRASLTLTLDRPALADLSFPYTITGIQAGDITDDDVDDDDNSLTGTITVPEGEAVGRETVVAENDITDEGSGETMTITLNTPLPRNSSSVRITSSVTSPTITITDDDGPITITEINIYPNTRFNARRVTPLSSPVGIDSDRLAVEVVLSQKVQETVRIPVQYRVQSSGRMCVANSAGDDLTCINVNSTTSALNGFMLVRSGFSKGQWDLALTAPASTVPNVDIRVCLPTESGDCRNTAFASTSISETERAISFADGVGTGTASEFRHTTVTLSAAPAPAAVCSGLTLVRDGSNSTISFAAADVLETLTLTLGGGTVAARARPVVTGGYQVYQINVPVAGRLQLAIAGNTGSDPEGFLVNANGCSVTSWMQDQGTGLNEAFSGNVSAGTYYVVAFDWDPGVASSIFRVGALLTATSTSSTNANEAVREQEARLLRQTRVLALDSTHRLTGMVGDLVRGRAGAPPDGVSLGSLPDEGDLNDVRSLMRSSLSLQQSMTSESGGRWSLWASTASGGQDAVNAGLEWASDDDRNISGIAMSFASASLPFASGAGLRNTGAWKWPAQWNEDMAIIAPYISRRSDSGEVWATAGFGEGAVHLGGGSAEARADSRLVFLQAGLAWGAVLDGGPRLDLETHGTAAHRETSAYRLGIYQVPDSGVGVLNLDSETAASWPVALADGTLTPRMSLDLAYDAADLLPGHGRRSADVGAELHWSRGAFSTNIKTSRALSHDTDSRDVSAGARWGLSHGLALGLDTSRRVTDGIGDAPVHRARLSGRWAF